MRLIFNIIYAILGFAAIILEFFVPSAGVIGILGAGFVIAGIVFTFIYYGLVVGTIFLVSCSIIGPIIIFLYFKIFPKSYVGKKLILGKTLKINTEKNLHLLNLEGISETTLRPTGYVVIEDSRYNVITIGDFIDKGTTVIVISIEGSKIIVSPKE